jgi:hypothetical protein
LGGHVGSNPLTPLALIGFVGLGFALVAPFAANANLWTPASGRSRVAPAAGTIVTAALAIGASIVLIAALSDIPLARFLFKRDNRMSHADLKRERREDTGGRHRLSAGHRPRAASTLFTGAAVSARALSDLIESGRGSMFPV